MSIAPGARLGPYEILAPLGAGGMGEVYRGRDTKLDREIAIKILPEAVAGDPERLARFEREAKVLASLNHPNVAQIYGVVESDKVRALVMELVPGGPVKGPLPLDTALDYARQIASALEAAHEKGIVHRDLKPGNILVTPTGTIKVLDFGLAMQQRETTAAASPEDSPTFTMNPTSAGVILGTAAYMSPEQARGEPVDKRTDIWAFGVVLYEMLTGVGIFGGKTVTDILASVLITEPDLSRVPPKVRRLLGRCLEKDQRKRLRDIGDAMLLVEEEAPAPAAAPPVPSRLPWIAAGVLLVIAAVAGVALWRGAESAHLPVLRVDVSLGDVNLAIPVGSSMVIISPDGMQVVYLATAAGQANSLPRLFLRKLDQPAAMELPGSQGANLPFFSPDGKWVGFNIGNTLYKVALDGTPAVRLSEPGPSSGSAWDENQSIQTAVILKGLVRTPAGGGNTDLVQKLADTEVSFLAPQILPDGKGVLYSILPVASSDLSRARVEVLTPGGKRRFVAQAGNTTRYLPVSKNAGYLVYAIKQALYAVAFDLDRLETHGAPMQVVDDIAVRSTNEQQFDVSMTGTLVYRKAHGSTASTTMLQWVDAAGKRESLPVKPAAYSYVCLAPDGRHIVADTRTEQGRIQIFDLQRETWTPIPDGGRVLFSPVWSNDSQSLIIGSLMGLLWARAAGSAQPQPLMTVKAIETGGSITPDGKRLVYVEGSSKGQLWTVPLEDAGAQLKAGAPEPYLKSSSKDTFPRFSPDGKWIAYASTATGTDEIYVRAFPDNGSVVKISNNGGTRPLWSPTSHVVLYQTGDQMMAVGYGDKGGTFVPEKPRVWTPKIGGTAFDISRDGKRLLVIVPVDSPNVTRPDHEIVLFQNFVEYLREKVK
jgi:serine/threonine-protein kinase